MIFLCGTYFKHQCWLQVTDYKDERTPEFSVKRCDDIENNFVFCKTEFLQMLKETNILKERPFTLVTHNSDINFTKENVEAVIEYFPNMEHWYTQNLLTENPRVSPIPIGIANPRWSHGNQDRFSRIIEENNKKDNLFYANFNVSTNASERIDCYKKIGVEPFIKYPNAESISAHDEFVNKTQEQYLRKISKSYFTVSPDGNGKDCHKTWEAIYMKSIPIVKDSYFARQFKEKGIPLLIINDWSEFKSLDLSDSLYNDLWKDFDPSSLNFNFFK